MNAWEKVCRIYWHTRNVLTDSHQPESLSFQMTPDSVHRLYESDCEWKVLAQYDRVTSCAPTRVACNKPQLTDISRATYISRLELKGFLFGIDYGVLLDVRTCPCVANYLWKKTVGWCLNHASSQTDSVKSILALVSLSVQDKQNKHSTIILTCTRTDYTKPVTWIRFKSHSFLKTTPLWLFPTTRKFHAILHMWMQTANSKLWMHIFCKMIRNAFHLIPLISCSNLLDLWEFLKTWNSECNFSA